jgi:RNA polymerase-binding transcription factor DksA
MMGTETTVGVKVCYSDRELNEFKDNILVKLQNINNTIEFLRGVNLEGGEVAHNSEGIFDSGSLTYSIEDAERTILSLINLRTALNQALLRIKHKSYGICKATEKLIPKERLKLIPQTQYCVEAKLAKQSKKK